jgi:rhodanese-related sulfurtransferase
MKTLALLLASALLAVPAARAEGLDPAQTYAALQRGAVAWDLRDSGLALLPGALRLPAQAVQRWRDIDDVAALSAAVSAAGLNLSSEVLIYADAADTGIAQLAARLSALSRGRVHHLNGGIEAWQAAGLPIQGQPSTRLPVPQRLVLAGAGAGAPASGLLRSTTTFGLEAARASVAAWK